jgi:DNA repair protein SbcD/Mre11
MAVMGGHRVLPYQGSTNAWAGIRGVIRLDSSEGTDLHVRLLHTADWHLGRLFHGVHLTDDQAHLLEQLCQLIADERPDAVLVSGDIYDRAIPPIDAVELLDETLYRIALDFQIPVLLIAGNHDNPARLGFGHRFMSRQGLHLFGTLPSADDPVALYDDDGPVHIFAAPYCEPAVVRSHLNDPAVECFDSAMRALLGVFRKRHPDCPRTVLLGHAFVQGGSPSDSERPLSIGGVDTVGTDCFAGFTYVALGHLHQPQSFSGARVRYSGSLMKYSFSEVHQRKSVSIVEIDGGGEVAIQEITLTPKRDVRRISGKLEELLTNPDSYGPRDDYLMADLLDEGAVYDALGRLREVFPNLLHLERSVMLAGDERRRSAMDVTGKGDLELFNDFMDAMTGQQMTDEQSTCFIAAVDELRRDEREAG